jgi:hypothetical protein
MFSYLKASGSVRRNPPPGGLLRHPHIHPVLSTQALASAPSFPSRFSDAEFFLRRRRAAGVDRFRIQGFVSFHGSPTLIHSKHRMRTWRRSTLVRFLRQRRAIGSKPLLPIRVSTCFVPSLKMSNARLDLLDSTRNPLAKGLSYFKQMQISVHFLSSCHLI